MKKLIVFALMSVFVLSLSAQADAGMSMSPEKASLSVGLLHGGGGLVGADFEALLSERIGFQLGAGLVSYGAGLNFHLKPGIRSSFLTLAYWHQGVGESHSISTFGPGYVFRGKKWFTAQIGLGYVLERGPAYPASLTETPMILTYSIGAYFPL